MTARLGKTGHAKRTPASIQHHERDVIRCRAELNRKHRLFVNALRQAGAEPVESVGRPFDPNLHEAVATAPPDGVKPGTVAREVRRGWRLGDELLRPAQVVVATEPEPSDRRR